MSPNGYDTLVQQTSIPLKEIIPLPPNQNPLSLLMKISSNHHRFGLWWLCYLCLCCFQNIFWPLAKIFPFLWICRWLAFICRAEGVIATIGLGCVTPLHVTFRLPFCLWLKPFLSCELTVDYFSFAMRKEWQLPLFTLPSGCLFTLGWDPSLLVNLPLLISRLLCRRSLAMVTVSIYESAASRRWWTMVFFSRLD